MQVHLPDLSGRLSLEALDRGNTWKSQVSSSGSFDIRPGTYLLRSQSAVRSVLPEHIGVLGLPEFVAPADGLVVTNNKADQPVKQPVGSQSLTLFQAGENPENLNVYSPEWEQNPYFIKKDAQGLAYLNLQHKGSAGAKTGGIQVYTGNKLTQGSELYINIDLKSNIKLPIRITLIDQQARACSAEITVRSSDRTISLPLSAFKPSRFVLLSRPYPGFQTFEFRESSNAAFDLKKLEKLQLMPQGNPSESFEVDIYSIQLSRVQKSTKLSQLRQ